MEAMFDWIVGNKTVLFWVGMASLVMFLGTIVAVPVAVACIPKDYFVRRRPGGRDRGGHPALRLALRILKNLLGVALLLLGLVMLVGPGQGVLTILLGLVLVEFPGKRALELRLVRRPRVLATLNWLRAKAGRPPLQL